MASSPSDVRDAVEATARASLGDIAAAVGTALQQIAALVERSGVGVEGVRARADALASSAYLDRAGLVREALLETVAALEGSVGGSAWLAAARSAAEEIDASVPIGLQHARVQDALRALADAAIAAGTRAPAAASGSASRRSPS
jgi:hypothetical protein